MTSRPQTPAQVSSTQQSFTPPCSTHRSQQRQLCCLNRVLVPAAPQEPPTSRGEPLQLSNFHFKGTNRETRPRQQLLFTEESPINYGAVLKDKCFSILRLMMVISSLKNKFCKSFLKGTFVKLSSPMSCVSETFNVLENPTLFCN